MPLVKKFAKSLTSGGFAAFLYLALTYVLTEFLGVHYLASVFAAFLIATLLNFSLQKLWTFGEKSAHRIPQQLFLFILLVVCNVVISTASIYFLVEMRGVWYVHAQMLMIAIFAVINFTFYCFVFKNKNVPPEITSLYKS